MVKDSPRSAKGRPLAGRRVALLVQNLPVPFDRRVWQEAVALSQAGAEVWVICPSDKRFPAGRHLIQGVRVIRYKAPPEARGALGYPVEYSVALYQIARTLWRRALRLRFDVIHFCNPPDLLVLAALPLRMLSRSKTVFDQHDLGPELVRAKHLPLSPVLVAAARLAERLTYAASDHVIATNESYKRIAIERGGLKPDRVTVVRSAPRAGWGASSAPSAAWNNGRSKMIGYVGVIGRQEGIEYLLRAVKHLVDVVHLDVQLCLVGSGPDIDRLKELAVSLGIASSVSFLGRLSDDDLLGVLNAADVCVNPDEVNEMNDLSTMNKIMEYMSLGKPIVQFDVTEGRFSAGESSLYAAPNDSISLAEKLAEVLNDPELASRMGRLGKQRFEQVLAWERQIPQLISAYQSVLSARLSR